MPGLAPVGVMLTMVCVMGSQDHAHAHVCNSAFWFRRREAEVQEGGRGGRGGLRGVATYGSRGYGRGVWLRRK